MSYFCPICSGKKIDKKIKEYSFPWGSPDPIILSVNVPVLICQTCKFEWTGHEAEQIIDEHVIQLIEDGTISN